MQETLLGDTFSFEDLKNQLNKLKSMGPLENILGMIPGMNKHMKDIKVDDREIGRIEAIINSMTPSERKDVNLLNGSRKKRIALGSGTTATDVNRLIKQYLDMKKMLKMFKKGGRMPSMNFKRR